MAATHLLEVDFRAWAPSPWGQLRVPSGDPGKCESATEQRRQSKAPLPLPRAVPAPKFLGFTAYPFCGDVEQICLGEGLRPEMGSPGQAGEGRASGLEPVQDSKACRA